MTTEAELLAQATGYQVPEPQSIAPMNPRDRIAWPNGIPFNLSAVTRPVTSGEVLEPISIKNLSRATLGQDVPQYQGPVRNPFASMTPTQEGMRNNPEATSTASNQASSILSNMKYAGSPEGSLQAAQQGVSTYLNFMNSITDKREYEQAYNNVLLDPNINAMFSASGIPLRDFKERYNTDRVFGSTLLSEKDKLKNDLAEEEAKLAVGRSPAAIARKAEEAQTNVGIANANKQYVIQSPDGNIDTVSAPELERRKNHPDFKSMRVLTQEEADRPMFVYNADGNGTFSPRSAHQLANIKKNLPGLAPGDVLTEQQYKELFKAEQDAIKRDEVVNTTHEIVMDSIDYLSKKHNGDMKAAALQLNEELSSSGSRTTPKETSIGQLAGRQTLESAITAYNTVPPTEKFRDKNEWVSVKAIRESIRGAYDYLNQYENIFDANGNLDLMGKGLRMSPDKAQKIKKAWNIVNNDPTLGRSLTGGKPSPYAAKLILKNVRRNAGLPIEE